MAWFSHLVRNPDLITLTPEEIMPDAAPPMLTGVDLDATRDDLHCRLTHARGRLMAIEGEIGRLKTEAENTRTAIAADEAAAKVLGEPPRGELRGLPTGAPVILTKHEGIAS